MVRFTPLASAACLFFPGAVARYLGPMDPAPVDIASSNSVVYAAWQNITAVLDTLAGSDLGNFTFSVGMFSAHDAAAQTAYQYHYTSPEVAQSPLGVDSVDGDSIYRVASISKLVSAFAGVLRLNASEWQRPLTEIFPEIAELTHHDNGDLLGLVQWDQITPRALVSQMTGLDRLALPDPEVIGPGSCTDLTNCSALDYIRGITTLPITFSPWWTPGYSNTNFVILGLVLQQLTNLTLEELFQEAIFEPLGMNHTSSLAPTVDGEDEAFPGYVVAGSVDDFATDGGITSASGGVFSTTNDLARFGVGILNATLLSDVKTREWMKPVAFTAVLDGAVGMGWEIYRYSHAGTGVTTDLYTKSGNSGSYLGYEVLIPDYGVGFSVLMANGNLTLFGFLQAQAIVADTVSEFLLPALQAQAGAEAKRNFAGTYTLADEQVEATLKLVYNETATPGAGLTVASLEVNGQDYIPQLEMGQQLVLQPAIQSASLPQQLSFQATGVGSSPIDGTGIFSKTFDVNLDWFLNDIMSVGRFDFALGANGKATVVTVAGLQATLKKVDE